MVSTLDSSPTSEATSPGWPEVAAAAVTYVVLLFLLPPVLTGLTSGDAALQGHVMAALSGVLGFAAFGAAFVIRRRGWGAFGVRRVSWRWLLAGLGLGIAAVALSRLLVVVIVALTGDALVDPQGSYQDAASAGGMSLALQLLLLGLLTGVGEEFAFRGVLTNALKRYGSIVAVSGSTVVFALAPGINLALIPAVIVGVIAAVLTVRCRSIWPGVVVHVVNNSLGTVVSLVLTAIV